MEWDTVDQDDGAGYKEKDHEEGRENFVGDRVKSRGWRRRKC